MPTEFPFVDDPDSELFLSILSAEADRYEVTFGFIPDCNGASVCNYGSVTVTPEAEGVVDLAGELVELGDSWLGQFVEATCGAGCSDADVLWQDDDYEYTIGLKAASIDDATNFASSARLIN